MWTWTAPVCCLPCVRSVLAKFDSLSLCYGNRMHVTDARDDISTFAVENIY